MAIALHDMVALGILAALASIAAFIDLKHLIIPDVINLAVLVSGVGASFLSTLVDPVSAISAIVVGAALVGTLGAVSYAAELTGAFPLGVAADYMSRRVLLTGGALLGALATQLFGLSGNVTIFFLSRALEGVAAAAIAPALLARLTDITDGNRRLRARAMSYFELSLLGGLGVGGLLAGHLWERLQSAAFSMAAAGNDPTVFRLGRSSIRRPSSNGQW